MCPNSIFRLVFGTALFFFNFTKELHESTQMSLSRTRQMLQTASAPGASVSCRLWKIWGQVPFLDESFSVFGPLCFI